MITRKQYMAGEATHQEYYDPFVTEAVVASVKNRFGKALLTSRDPYFNDIPLTQWDQIAMQLRPVLDRRISEANGSGGVSLSDLVCTVKAAARRIKIQEEYPCSR